MNAVVPSQKPFSVQGMPIVKTLRKLTKMVKPIMKLLSRRARTNAVTPSCCCYDVEETQNRINGYADLEESQNCLNGYADLEESQNRLNEGNHFDVEFRFHEEEDENAINEAIENRLREEVAAKSAPIGIRVMSNGVTSVQPVVPGTYFAVPVHFVEATSGGFQWVPLADSDFATNTAVTELQQPAQQVPCLV